MEDVTRAIREVHSEATLLFFPLLFLARDGLGSRWAAIRAETRARAAYKKQMISVLPLPETSKLKYNEKKNVSANESDSPRWVTNGTR